MLYIQTKEADEMRKPLKIATIAATLAAALAVSAACTTSNGKIDKVSLPPVTQATASQLPAAMAANPVDLLRKAGALPNPGVVYGERDLDGNPFAEGKFPGTEEALRIYTFTSFAARDARITQAGLAPDDSHRYVVGRYYIAYLTAEQKWGGPDGRDPVAAFPVTADTVATRLGGAQLH